MGHCPLSGLCICGIKLGTVLALTKEQSVGHCCHVTKPAKKKSRKYETTWIQKLNAFRLSACF